MRSYLGKAYYEEKRDAPAREELDAARLLDPRDPTPWLHDAIRQQSVNRPVEALDSLERSIALNDNRAVHRSRLLLDQDLAARSAGLARLSDTLGFEQLALVQGWSSLGNLLDTRFHFRDTDPVHPTIAPDRLVLVRLTLSF